MAYLSCGAAIHTARPGTLSHGALFLSPEWEPSTTSTSTEFKINFITQEICLLGYMNLLPALKDLAVSSVSLLAEALLSSFMQVAPRGAPSCPHAAKPQK